jgi:3-oxoacyl-[acyl-carrier protein] reductase
VSVSEPRGERLRGRVAIVTGGGWNIGRAIACAFAAEGARVVVASRRGALLEETVSAIAERGGEALAMPADVTDPRDVERLVHAATERFGPVDLMAAIAGGGSVDLPIDALAPEEFERIVRTNLTSAFLCARAVLPAMRARNRGDILTCAGGGASFPVVGVHCLAYACAKAAVCRLTDQLTAELLDTEIRVNCIDPGMVPDAARRAELEAEEQRQGAPFSDAAHRRRPEDVAELAVWLVSDASRPLRGRVVSVYDRWWREADGARSIESSVAACRLRRFDPHRAGDA